MGILARVATGLGTALVKAANAVEGQFRLGPYPLPVTGGMLTAQAGQFMNWWQLGYDPVGAPTSSAIVEACISAYSQTVAMCPGSHWRANDKNGRDRVKNSALSRILKSPNAYQSGSDFQLNLVRSLYYEGNAYALALRNDRFEVSELHLMNPRISRPQIAPTGDIFYQLGGNSVIEREVGAIITVPARDVLHVRMHTDRRYPYPLIGETPLMAAMGDIANAQAMTDQQLAYFLNQARPSAVLSTDLVLDRTQTQELRDRWDEMSQGINQGKTPILSSGLKVIPWATPPKDAQLAELMKIGETHIALAYRIPLQILGLGGTNYATTEALMQSWIASGLGFALNHVEEAYGLLFALKGQPDEYVEFDTAALLRSAFKDRIDGLVRAVQGGIYSPNEARNSEGLDDVEFGDEPRVQQQVIPLSAASKIPGPASPAAPPSAPPPPVAGSEDKPPKDDAPAEEDDEAEPAKPAKDYRHVVDREARGLIARASRDRLRTPA